MENNRYFMRRYVRGADGQFAPDGSAMDLERDFLGLRIEGMVSLNVRGAQKVYEEKYADDEQVQVHIPSEAVHEQTEVTMKAVFLAHSMDADVPKAISEVEEVYDRFCAFLDGAHLLYWDDTRRKKAFLYLSAPTVSKDVVKGQPYLQVSFKFKNVYGRTFTLDDDTIPSVSTVD